MELVIVILILGIVAAVAQPKFSGALTRYRIEATANRVAADLNYAAAMARVSSKPAVVRFVSGDAGGRHYYRFDAIADPNIPGRSVDPSVPATWYTVVLSDEPYGAIIQSAPASITYDIYGFPSANASVIVRSGNQQRTVTVARSSGKAVVQ